MKSHGLILCTGVILLIINCVRSEKFCLGKADPKGIHYEGFVRHTASGVLCRKWNASGPRNGTEIMAKYNWNHRFCRNPEGAKNRPWCFTSSTGETWKYCEIMKCSDEKCGVQFFDLSFERQKMEIRNDKIVKSRVKRVIGGDDNKRGTLPWTTSLRQSDWPICSATLIRKSYVLSAAHCIPNGLSAKELTVTTGHTDMFAWKNEGGQERKVEKYIKHPKFKHNNAGLHDIVVIKTDQPFDIDEYSRPACIPSQGKKVKPGTMCVGAGWGLTFEADYAGELKQVVMPIQKNNKCNFKHPHFQLCAGYFGDPHGTCIGDSGGPLLCMEGGYWTLFGITSFASGRDCSQDSAWVGGYTRVSSYSKWIEKTITALDKKKFSRK